MRRIPPVLLLATAAGAGMGFATLARAVSQRQLKAIDRSARDQAQSQRTQSGDMAAKAVSPLGSEVVHAPVALAVSTVLARNNVGIAAAALPLLASAATVAMSEIFERGTDIQDPPPGHPKQHEASFPSGHALETSAVGLTSAYVLGRQKLVPPVPALALVAAISVATTAGRIHLDRHWVSDAAGGWLLGIATAATLCAAYEALADRKLLTVKRPHR
jgi:membrane-associated phospholipid phosphatase